MLVQQNKNKRKEMVYGALQPLYFINLTTPYSHYIRRIYRHRSTILRHKKIDQPEMPSPLWNRATPKLVTSNSRQLCWSETVHTHALAVNFASYLRQLLARYWICDVLFSRPPPADQRRRRDQGFPVWPSLGIDFPPFTWPFCHLKSEAFTFSSWLAH